MLYPGKRTQLPARWRPYQTDNLYWRIDNYYRRPAHREILKLRQILADAEIRAEARRKREEEQARYVEMVKEMQPLAFEEHPYETLSMSFSRLMRRKVFGDFRFGFLFWSHGG